MYRCYFRVFKYILHVKYSIITVASVVMISQAMLIIAILVSRGTAETVYHILSDKST